MKRNPRALGAAIFLILLLLSCLVSAERLDIVDSLLQAGSRDSALKVLQAAFADPHWPGEAGDIEIARAFLKISEIHYDQRAYASALANADSAQAHIGTEAESESGLKRRLYEVQGKALRRLRRPVDAQLVLEKAARMFRDSLLVDPPGFAQILNFLALAKREAGDLDGSVHTAEEAVEISQAEGSLEDIHTAQYCNTLARGLQLQGRYEEAAALYSKAIGLSTPSLGQNHPNLTAFYNNLGNVYSDMGRFDEALASYEKALTIREEQLGPDDPRTARALNNVALVYYNTGQYAEAESRYRRALDIFRAKLGPRHEYVGAMNMNLGALYLDQRRFADAEAVLIEGKSIFEELDPGGHPQIAGILKNIAIVARSTGREDEAERYLNEALRLNTDRFGERSPQTASTLNSLGVLAYSRGDLAVSSTYLMRALAIELEVYGDSHPEVAARLLNLAELRSQQEDPVAADSLFEQATNIWTAVYGPRNRWVAEAWERRATSLRRRGENSRAWDLLTKAFNIRLTLFTQNARVLSEPDALAYSTFLRHTTDLLLSGWQDLESTPARDSVVARVVFSSKAKVWDELTRRSKKWQQTADSVSISLAEKIRSTRWQLARAYVAGPSESQPAYRTLLDSLAQRAEEYESALAGRSFEYRKMLEASYPNAKLLATRLPKGTALLDYLRYQYRPANKGAPVPYYLAVVLQGENLQVVSLGPAGPIDDQVEKLRQHIQAVAEFGGPLPGDVEDYRRIARDLYSKILAPASALILPGVHLLLAPDGPLCVVAWGGLVVDSASYLVEHHDITYLGSGRDLLPSQAPSPSKSGLLAVGYVDFDAGSEMVPVAGESRSRSIGRAPVSPLEGTLEEVKSIAALWTRTHGEPAELLLGADATETAFKNKAPHHRVLHIATHGFYTNPRPEIETYDLIDFAFERKTTDNPLLRSGLYFAGVNSQTEGAGEAAYDDGVLTAMEVSALPLTGTDVVVLSACETGLGTVLEGEGVFGLRRAFHLAGVQTVVGSLWRISDSRTAELMRSLYQTTGLSMDERLLKYQRELLASLRQADLPDHPFFWAPFVAVSRY